MTLPPPIIYFLHGQLAQLSLVPLLYSHHLTEENNARNFGNIKGSRSRGGAVSSGTELVITIPRQGFSPVLYPEITRLNF